MSHLYDTEEPNVVSEALLRECVRAQGPRGEAGRVADEEGVAFSEVRELRLDFKSEAWGALLVDDVIGYIVAQRVILHS